MRRATDDCVIETLDTRNGSIRSAVQQRHSAKVRPVCTENLNPTIVVMKSTKDGA
jgi:hypothetical protein